MSDPMSPPDKGPGLPVAYRNENFLSSRDARSIRILAEYLHPLSHFRLERIHDTVVFFGSARIHEEGPMARYYSEARELAKLVTEWSLLLDQDRQRFVVATGGGPGIMEAANRGAHDAGGKSVGLNIGLPFEQAPNPYITPELNFEFHYFFMRKFWFSYLAKAMVVMPGGFGTFDEFMEVVTLVQTLKIKKHLPIVLYGSEYWDQVLNFEPMVKFGTIGPEDLKLFYRTDSVDDAYRYIVHELETHVLNKNGNGGYMGDPA